MLAYFDAKPFGLFCEKHAGWVWCGCRIKRKLTKRYRVFQTVKRFAGDAGYGALTYLTSAKPLCLLVHPIVCLMFYPSIIQGINVKTRLFRWVDTRSVVMQRRLLLPCTLLVAVRLEALPAFVFRHLQTPFLFQIAHRYRESGLAAKRAVSPLPCKAEFSSLASLPRPPRAQ